MRERYEVSSTKSGILLIILRPKRRVRVNNCRNGRSAIATEHPSLPDVINQKSDIDERGPYYARWFHAASTLLVEKGLLTRDELESGQRRWQSRKRRPDRRRCDSRLTARTNLGKTGRPSSRELPPGRRRPRAQYSPAASHPNAALHSRQYRNRQARLRVLHRPR